MIICAPTNILLPNYHFSLRRLHSKEGDLSNSGYWYGRAGRRQANVSLDEEWTEIVNALVNENR
jgi:hypothetical protein